MRQVNIHEAKTHLSKLIADGKEVVIARYGEPVARLGAGDVCGELSLLTGQPRNASVTIDDDAWLMAFHRGEFMQLLDECRTMSAQVLEGAVRRMSPSD